MECICLSYLVPLSVTYLMIHDCFGMQLLPCKKAISAKWNVKNNLTTRIYSLVLCGFLLSPLPTGEKLVDL